jgi:hypothetical protein
MKTYRGGRLCVLEEERERNIRVVERVCESVVVYRV